MAQTDHSSTAPLKTDDGRDLMSELDKIAAFLDSEKCGPSARIVEVRNAIRKAEGRN